MNTTQTHRSSPVGPLTLVADDRDRLCRIEFASESSRSSSELCETERRSARGSESSRSSSELCETERRSARGCDQKESSRSSSELCETERRSARGYDQKKSSRSSSELCETERRSARGCDQKSGVLAEAALQLDEYFAGTRRDFELDLAPQGTPFQLAVWDALLAIPYGATASYGDIARSVGRPNAVRAVGQANGRNPLAIVVPCHRVIGSDRSLTGYGGGINRKRFLLALEGAPLTAALDL